MYIITENLHRAIASGATAPDPCPRLFDGGRFTGSQHPPNPSSKGEYTFILYILYICLYNRYICLLHIYHT